VVAMFGGSFRSRFIKVSILTVLLFLVFSACADAANDSTPRKAMVVNVSGECAGRPVAIKTLDRSDNLLSGSDIVVYLRNVLVASMTTDRRGNANFTPNETGVYTLRITRARFKGMELEVNITDCGSCKDGIKNQDETAVDCGGLCAPCTTTTTTTTTTSSSTTTTTRATTTTRRTTTTEPTTTTTTTIPTTTTTLPAKSSGLDMGIIAIIAFFVIVIAAYFIYSGYIKGKPEDSDEDHPQKSSELYKKSMEAAGKKPPEGYKGYNDKSFEAGNLSGANKMHAEFKNLREEAKKPVIEKTPQETSRGVDGERAGKLDKDFAEIEKLEGELKALKKDMKGNR
jgi:hypothetical protein